MSGIMVRADWPLYMQEGPRVSLAKMWDQTLDALPSLKEWYYHVEKTDQPFVAELGSIGLGPARRKLEGVPGMLDKPAQGRTMTYVFPSYSLGVAISREAQDDDKQNKLVPLVMKELARSMFETMEEDAANQLNDAFNAIGWEADGVALCSASHPILKTGGTVSNISATAAALSITSLDAAMLSLRTTLNDTGRILTEITPEFLDLNPALLPDALRIIKTERVLGSNNNDKNLYFGMLTPRSNPRLSNANRWFLRSSKHQWKWFNRLAKPEFDTHVDPIAKSTIMTVYHRWGRGASDWRGVYGSDAP